MVKEFCCENKRKAYELIESTNSRLMGASTNETKKRWQIVRAFIPFLSTYDKVKMNKAVRDYKEEKGVARDYLQEVKKRLDDCNCVEEKEGRFNKLELHLDTLLAEVDRVRKEMTGWKKEREESVTITEKEKDYFASTLPEWTIDHIPGRHFWNKNANEQKLGNLIRKGVSLGSDGGGYKKSRKEGVIEKIKGSPNEWSFKRLEIASGDREKKRNLLIHDSCEFRDGKLVREYGKFHYKKSFTKEELKEIKQTKNKNYHNRLITQVEIPPKEKD